MPSIGPENKYRVNVSKCLIGARNQFFKWPKDVDDYVVTKHGQAQARNAI